MRQVREAAAAKGKAKAKPKAKGKALKWPSEIPHHRAKDFCPPEGSVWRGLTRRTWNGHFPPCRRVSASWDAPGGENAALKSVLRRLWRSYVDHLGLEDSVAPEGIWAGDAI